MNVFVGEKIAAIIPFYIFYLISSNSKFALRVINSNYIFTLLGVHRNYVKLIFYTNVFFFNRRYHAITKIAFEACINNSLRNKSSQK